MARTVAIGIQDFSTLIEKNYFYIDKTSFIKEWWEAGDSVTLIARPRRFGKTLNMSMVEQFFSVDYADRGELFEGLSIWEEEGYRKLQGTYPVISLSFANIKENNYISTKEKICQMLTNLYVKHYFLRDSGVLTEKDREYFDRISSDMRDSDATLAIYQLSDFLYRYYGKKSLSFWMNMIRQCRRPMCMDFGRNWYLLPEVCSIPALRPIHGWRGQL